ncbi:hypothetical protein [Arsenophonus sp.]|uniref:hypothetical protein n=1 Tax=Arsenophonus sp. TaxID=1872640 RepID=UPI00387A627A
MDLTTQSEVIESIEENRATSGSSKEKPFRELGYDSGIYYLISKEQLQVLPFKARDLKESNLLQLAPLSWWRKNYPQYNDAGNPKKIPDWSQAADDIMRRCAKAGVYSPKAIRGLGFWKDGNKIIYHKGNALLDVINNKKISMLDSSLENIYPKTKQINQFSTESATNEQLDLFIQTINSIYWKHKTHAQLALGWIVLARLCGLLNWRPHIWITGEYGAGKSETVLEAIKVGVGTDVLIDAKGATTEAGLRQEIGHNAIPIVIDEAEPNTPKDRLRLDSILTLSRNASSDDQARVFKGTVSGESQSFTVRGMFCFSSIGTHRGVLADQSRISVLEIVKKTHTEQTEVNFNFIHNSLIKLKNEGFAEKLSNLMISRLSTLESNLKVCVQAASQVLGSGRNGKQYGTLIAGYATYATDIPLTLDEAKTYIEDIELPSIVDENIDSEETSWSECFTKMNAVKIPFRDSRSNVSTEEGYEMLRELNFEELSKIVGFELTNGGGAEGQRLLKDAAMRGKREIEKGLRKLGIIYQDGSTSLFGCVGEGLYIANSSEAMSKALAGTKFENWKQYSERVGEKVPKTIKIDGKARRFNFILLKK